MSDHLSAPHQWKDVTGKATLDLFADTDRFNSWLFSTLAPYCTDNILEIGSGTGNISAFLERAYKQVALSDLQEEYCELLRQRFAGSASVKDIFPLDLSITGLETQRPELLQRFNTIMASNVVEHIEDDRLAISNCRQMLKPGGRLVILVPAYQWLYNSFDKELGHYRRYTRRQLSRLMEEGGFRILHTQYFNAAGMLGWWFSGSVLRKKILPKNQLTLYNKLVPVFKVADKILLQRAGLSVIAAGELKN